MKKWGMLLIAVMMVTLVLAACGQEKITAETRQTTPAKPRTKMKPKRAENKPNRPRS
ncbi:hypothetical protein HMSSN139_30520 [Paenibacillus sp. HMSSN-139]|nr:hypothetical protein HMSSN139_30520 [Paenibacillus sp. HMSSN-139]